MGLLDSIKKVPSFANMASEGDVLAHIRDLENKATKVDALEKAVNTYKQKLQEVEDKEVTAFIDKAIAEKRITDAQKESFTALMKSDRENTEKLIGPSVALSTYSTVEPRLPRSRRRRGMS